jgi:hypothetical protein
MVPYAPWNEEEPLPLTTLKARRSLLWSVAVAVLLVVL